MTPAFHFSPRTRLSGERTCGLLFVSPSAANVREGRSFHGVKKFIP